MKKNRGGLILLLILLLISVYFLFFRNGFSTLNEKDNEFAVQDTTSISKIIMTAKNNKSVTLTRASAAVWMVNDKYVAREDVINNLLYTMKMVAVKNLVDQSSWNSVIKDLATGAIKVEIFKGDDKIKSYYVGGETADHLGTYMLLINSRSDKNYSQPYIMYIPGFDGYLTSRFLIPEEDWRDRTIFRYYPNQIKVVRVVYPQQPDSSFQINVVRKNHFVLTNPVTNQPVNNFDTTAVKQYLTYCQSISWEVTINTPLKDSILHSIPITEISVQDTAGITHDVKLFLKPAPDNVVIKYGKDYKYDPDRMYALINGKDFAIVQYFVFGKMMMPVRYFLHQ
jgi:hypothetical protein